VTALTVPQLVFGLSRICQGLEGAADELNALDGKLGDGDLGVTMQRGARDVAALLDDAPDDLGQLLLQCAQAFTRTSGSSYGTLLATGLMAAAKFLRGRQEAPWSELAGALGVALDAMQRRGRAALGDKTVLDVIDAARRACEGTAEPAAILAAVDQATAAALAEFRDRPARVGRARMFGERSVGLDDPGMVAFRRMIDALKAA